MERGAQRRKGGAGQIEGSLEIDGANPDAEGSLRIGEVRAEATGAGPVITGVRSVDEPTGPRIEKGGRWEPDEVGAAVHQLLEQAVPPQKVYGT